MERKYFIGKFEQINGQWYPVTLKAYNIKEANKMLFKGQKKSYGTVQNIKGRWVLADF